jgi:hypothetical protein
MVRVPKGKLEGLELKEVAELDLRALAQSSAQTDLARVSSTVATRKPPAVPCRPRPHHHRRAQHTVLILKCFVVYNRSSSENRLPPVDALNLLKKDRESQTTANFPLSPLELTLTRSARTCPDSQGITPLESTPNLLSPLERTLARNTPVSPLELTLTKYKDLKSHRITLFRKTLGRGVPIADQRSRDLSMKAGAHFFTSLLRYLVASRPGQVAASLSRCHNPIPHTTNLMFRHRLRIAEHESRG